MESACGDVGSNDRDSFCGPSFRLRRRAAVFKARKHFNAWLDSEGTSDTDDCKAKNHGSTGETVNRAVRPQGPSTLARTKKLKKPHLNQPLTTQLLLKAQVPLVPPPSSQPPSLAKPPPPPPSAKVPPPSRVFSQGRVRQRVMKSTSSEMTSSVRSTDDSSSRFCPPDRRTTKLNSQTDADTAGDGQPSLKMRAGANCQRLSHHRKKNERMVVEAALSADSECSGRLPHSYPTKEDAPIDYMAVYHRLRMGRFGNLYDFPSFAFTSSSSPAGGRCGHPAVRHRSSGTSRSAGSEPKTNVTHLLRLLRDDFGLPVGAATDVSAVSDSNVMFATDASECKASTENSLPANDIRVTTDETAGASENAASNDKVATITRKVPTSGRTASTGMVPTARKTATTAAKIATTDKVTNAEKVTITGKVATTDNFATPDKVGNTSKVSNTAKVAPTQKVATTTKVVTADKVASTAKIANTQKVANKAKVASSEKVADKTSAITRTVATAEKISRIVASSDKTTSTETAPTGSAKLVVSQATTRRPVPKPRRSSMSYMSQATTVTTWSGTASAPGVSTPSDPAAVSVRSTLSLSVATCGPFASVVVCNAEPFESARSFRLSPRPVTPRPVEPASIGWRRVRYRCADLRIHQRLSLTGHLHSKRNSETSSGRWLSSSALLTQVRHPSRVELSAQVRAACTDAFHVASTSHQNCDTTWHTAAEVEAPATRFAFQAMKRRRSNRRHRAQSRDEVSRREKTTNSNFYSVPVC